jgi:quercetin dioxygenase-like cupin family protein
MSGNVVKVGQLEIRYLVDGAEKGGLGAFELKIPPGSNVPPPHSHTRNEECVYVLEGVLRYAVDKVTRDLKPGNRCRHLVGPCINSAIRMLRPLVP